MATKLLLPLLLAVAVLVHGASAQPKTRTKPIVTTKPKATGATKPTKPGPVASAGLPVAALSIAPLPFPTPCISESFGCCSRSLVNNQTFLDYLDSLTADFVFKGPKECSRKLNVFILSTGIDATNDAFRGIEIVVEPDCVDTSVNPVWTPNIDVNTNEGGTIVAGTVAARYGVTPNVILHSVKVSEIYGNETAASALCGIGRVLAWLRDNPCSQAIVAVNLPLVQYQSDGVLPVNDAVSALVRDFGDRVVVVTEFLRTDYTTYPAAVLPEVLGVGACFVNPNGTMQSFAEVRTYSLDVFLVNDYNLGPVPVNQLDYSFAFSADIGVGSGVLAQYWVEHPQLTGNQLRHLIMDNTDSDLHASGLVFDVPAGFPNKLLRYKCNGGCEPCLNGGTLLNNTGTLTCQCPADISGFRCEILLCLNAPFGHPAYCERYVTCSGGNATVVQCGKQDGIQLYYDVPTGTCQPPCVATPRPGCVARSC